MSRPCRVSRPNLTVQRAHQKKKADERNRTPGPRITNALLYHLSYVGLEFLIEPLLKLIYEKEMPAL